MSRLRVAAHVHSSWSYDGRWSLRRIATGFGRLGYDAVLLAEHDRGFDPGRWSDYRRACARASTDRTLLVPGLEYSDPANTVHVPVWGDIPFLGDGVATGELLRRCQAAGGVAILAHVGRRRAWQAITDDWLDRVIGVELWNRKYDGYAPNPVAVGLLQRRPDLLAFVSLDFHTARQLHPLAMVLPVTGGIGEGQVVDALRESRAWPTAFGMPATQLATGAAGTALRGLERGRGRVRALAR